jgi:hypothetical protein
MSGSTIKVRGTQSLAELIERLQAYGIGFTATQVGNNGGDSQEWELEVHSP